MANYATIARVSQIPEERGCRLVVRSVELAVFRLGDQFVAIADRCPHRGAPLGEGHREDGKIFCPMHGYEFDLKTGDCRDNPAKPVRTFPLRIQGEEIQIDLDALPSLSGAGPCEQNA